MSDASSSVSEDSQPPMEVDYPLNEAVEVPGTDGGLFKTVLVEGTFERPVKGAKVTVHYVGTLEDGTKFDSSRDRGEYFEFTLGKGQVIKGWDKGVATMRTGEKAILKCSPEYGYGASGSPPTIPPNATLLFEVELIDWTRDVDISTNKDRSLMKSVLTDGVDYENPAFESEITMSVAVYVGPYDATHPEANGAPVWLKKDWSVQWGETELPPQLDVCLATMRKREVAAFRVRSDLIPDAAAAFNIPSAEARDGADVTYVVDIRELRTVKTWEFAGKEKIVQGVARKDKGNAAFQAGNLKLAERFYRRALEFIGEDYGFDEEDKPECRKARVAVNGNLAQVLLMGKSYPEVITLSEKVLELDPTNAKALFRLAKAQDALQNWETALQAIDKLLAAQPDNAEAQALRTHVQSEQKAYDKKQKSMFQKMFS